MSQKLTDAMNKLTVEGSRHSLGIIGRPPPSPGVKRLSGLDPSIINSMFPDAAAAIAKQKEQFTAQTGMAPPSPAAVQLVILLFATKSNENLACGEKGRADRARQ